MLVAMVQEWVWSK